MTAITEEQRRQVMERLEEIKNTLPFNMLRDDEQFYKYLIEHGLWGTGIAFYMLREINRIDAVKKTRVKPLSKVTVGELCDAYDEAKAQFVIVHQVNYILHNAMLEVYDLLEKERRLSGLTKKKQKDAERVWESYRDTWRGMLDQAAWYVIQDDIDIFAGKLTSRLEEVYVAIRNYMIRLGWRDVELMARAEVCLLLDRVRSNTQKAFFREYYDRYDADFSLCYDWADLAPMTRYFAAMLESMGFKLNKDENGGYDFRGFDIDDSIRVRWAWDDFIRTIRDEDLRDDAAMEALQLNPEAHERYQQAFNEAEHEQMQVAVSQLSEKFNVKPF